MDGYTAVTLSFFGFLFVAGVLAAMGSRWRARKP
jgi:hypothetical protein